MVDQALPGTVVRPVGRGGAGLRRALRRKSTVAFLMTLSDPVLTTDARFSDPFRR